VRDTSDLNGDGVADTVRITVLNASASSFQAFDFIF
jgi:hypothetical protein